MPEYPDWCYHAMESSLFVFYVIVLASAAKKGIQWVATLLYGTVFGLALEILNVGGANPSYNYATDKFWCIRNAAVWVGLGWGIATYGSIRTAYRLDFRSPILSGLLWRPLAAGYLAVSIDFTLDPIAHALRFWEWHCDCLLRSPEPAECPVPCPFESATDPLLRYFGVPFDNFVGWMAIVFMYSLSVFAVSLVHRCVTKQGRPLALPLDHLFRGDGPLHARRGSPADAYPRAHEVFYVWVAPLLSLLVTGLLFWFVLRPFAMTFYAASGGARQLQLCLIMFVVFGVVTGYVALLTDRTQPDIDWIAVLIPIFFHGVPILLLLLAAFHARPELFLRVPANLALSMLVFTWPFQNALVARGRALFAAWQRGCFSGLLQELCHPTKPTTAGSASGPISATTQAAAATAETAPE